MSDTAPAPQPFGSNVPANPGDNALLVTSGPARAATAENVNKLQTITTPPATDTSGSDKSQQNNQGSSSSTSQPPADGSASMNEATARALFGKDFTGLTKNTDGSYTADKTAMARISSATAPTATNDGSTSSTADPYDSALSSITDPGLRSQFKTSLQALDTQVSQAKSNLDNAQALSANDPAATAAINAIKTKYDSQIQLMKDKNKQLLGRFSTGVAAFGGLGPMSQDFLSEEQARADGRISTLQNQEQEAITKAQIAYQTGDMKSLNTAMTAYDAANKAKLTELNTLLTETNKQVTQMQAQQKIDAAAEKQSVSLDISKSSNLGVAVAKNIADAGLTDPQKISDYIASVAQEYGITNPDILASAVTKAQQAATRAADTHANTMSEIKKRNTTGGSTKGSGTDGTFKYTQSDVDAYSALLNQGGKDPQGNTYGKRGSDGYVDPGAYVAALGDWVANGGTPAGFASKFPVKKNVNPDSYALLPQVIRPAAAATQQFTTSSTPPAK